MATGTTNSIGKNDGITSSIRLYYSTSFNAATSTSTVSLTPQLSAGSLGSDVRFYSGGVSSAGVYGGATTSTSNLYSLSSNYGSGQYLKATGTSWNNLNPQSGSISTFTIKHGKDGKATFYGGIVGKLITMYDYSTSTYQNISGNKNGCTATITESAPYSITYNANGGSGAPSSQAVFATYSYDLSATTPTRSGYNFIGWATSSSATEAEYIPNQSVSISGNLALYAVWSQTSKTVFLTAGENIASVYGSGTYITGQTVTCSAVMDNDPNYTYSFDGWYNGNTFVSSDNPYVFTLGNVSVSLEARASRTQIDIPGISSITTPDGSTYAIKDAYARDAIENLPTGGGGIAVQDTEPTHGELVWIDTDDPGTAHSIVETSDLAFEDFPVTWATYNCSGTITADIPTFKISGDGKMLWFSGGRPTITSFSRSGSNPGIRVASTSLRPSSQINFYGGIRIDNSTVKPETIWMTIQTSGEILIRTTETLSNASGNPLRLFVPACMIPII